MSFALRNSWADTLAADKTHYREFTAKSQLKVLTLLFFPFSLLCFFCACLNLFWRAVSLRGFRNAFHLFSVPQTYSFLFVWNGVCLCLLFLPPSPPCPRVRPFKDGMITSSKTRTALTGKNPCIMYGVTIPKCSLSPLPQSCLHKTGAILLAQ